MVLWWVLWPDLAIGSAFIGGVLLLIYFAVWVVGKVLEES